jgi:hypothetical protein
MKNLILKPVINKANGQINFSIKKNLLPEKFKDRLPTLKGIKFDLNDLEFEDI